MTKRLYRSSDKMISGVCGGLAEYFDADPTVVRILWAAVTLLTSGIPGVILYLVCAVAIPMRPSDVTAECEVVDDDNDDNDEEFDSYFKKK